MRVIDYGLPVRSAAVLPSWRASQVAQTWIEVPVEAMLSTLNPANDPTLNPNYPSKPEYMSSISTSWVAMYSAWNGGVWNEARKRWANVITGGHADNASNEMFEYLLGLSTTRFERLTKPSGWDGSVITDDRPVTQAGSAGDTVVLAGGANAPVIFGGTDGASNVNGAYVGQTISIASRPIKTITAYDGSTYTATVDSSYTDPIEGRFYLIGNGTDHGTRGEQTGRYSDGRARSVHGYNKPVHVPADGAYYIPVLGAPSWTASRGDANLTVRIDEYTGAHTFFSGPPSPLTGYAPAGSGSCYDPTRGTNGSIWWFGQNGSRFGRLDVETKEWTVTASIGAQAGYVALCRLPGDLILLALDGAFKVFDCAAETLSTPTFSGTAAGGVNDYGHAQPVYVAADNRVYWWNNPSGSTEAINYMTVPANPKTDTWTIQQTTPAGSNVVTPGARQANGTYGRFFYSESLDGFGLLNDVATAPLFYARADLA